MASIRIISPSASSSYRSAWNSRSVPSSERANVLDTSRLPTPGGPWKRYACAGPSRNAASRRRPASRCSEKRANVVTNLLCDRFGRSATVDGNDALRLALGQRPVRSVDAVHELVVLLLDPISHVA